MKQASHNRAEKTSSILQMKHRLREGLFLCAHAWVLFLFIALITYHPSDPGWSTTGMNNTVLNSGGRAGAFIADVLLSLFGIMSFGLLPMILYPAWMSLKKKSVYPLFQWGEWLFKTMSFLCILFCGCGLTAIYFKNAFLIWPQHVGGIAGDLMITTLNHIFNKTGSILFLVTGWLCGITFFTGFSWLGFFKTLWESCVTQLRNGRWRLSQQRTQPTLIPVPKSETLCIKEVSKEPFKESSFIKKNSGFESRPTVTPRQQEPASFEKITDTKKNLIRKFSKGRSDIPSLSLLNPVPAVATSALSVHRFEELSHFLEQRLLDFGIEVKVVAVNPGPVVTRLELELAPGIKVSKVVGLSKDIARSLSMPSVRVVEVIPGKAVIGLELPNENRETVSLRDILESERYAQSSSPVSLALGKDISGHPVIVDLAKMPHLLVAGTTGSGKSVNINAMLLSLLFKSTPEQLRLILIDPKMLELSIYEGIPHLLTPVITDMKDAANALRWCVAEMDRRYRLMSLLGVRNLASCNLKIKEAIDQGQPLAVPLPLQTEENHDQTLDVLPMIVVVIDELADMMMVVGKKVEELVTRIAQKARAAGIHLILATQRPSVDVITGLIKANVPTRIAFQVSSRIDSRTILDQQGAEHLLGSGDMLYLPPGTGIPIRVHGAYVADEEVHRVVSAWKEIGTPLYVESITREDHQKMGEADAISGEKDPLYDEALRIITETRRASISLVQRRLRIGYNRAARIIEDMEAAGVVTTMDTSGSREVLAPPPPHCDTEMNEDHNG